MDVINLSLQKLALVLKNTTGLTLKAAFKQYMISACVRWLNWILNNGFQPLAYNGLLMGFVVDGKGH